jgi:hypothetical protein
MARSKLTVSLVSGRNDHLVLFAQSIYAKPDRVAYV